MSTESRCKNGHIKPGAGRCPQCRKASFAAWYERNREAVCAKVRERAATKSDLLAEQARDRYQKNRVSLIAKAKAHRDANLEYYRAYDRKRRAERPEAKSASDRAWYQKNREKQCANAREWRAKNPERDAANHRAWKRANPERDLELKRRWRDNNIEHARALARKQNAKNPAKCALVTQRRRARLKGSNSPGVTLAEWTGICRQYLDADGEQICAYCEKRCTPTIEHVVPIARGGLDEPSNVLPVCKRCNGSKNARLIYEWHRAKETLSPERLAQLTKFTREYFDGKSRHPDRWQEIRRVV